MHNTGGEYFLAETTIKTNTTECSTDITTVVTEVDTVTDATTTTTTNNRNTTTCETIEAADDESEGCNQCGHFDLRKLAEESHCAAFRSSNIAAATNNSVIIFTMRVLQELIIKECRKGTLDVNTITSIATSMGDVSLGIKVYNNQPFDS